MRVCHVFAVATAAFLASDAVISANPSKDRDSELVTGGTTGKRNLRAQLGFLEWPEELEEFVHLHHHIREMFTRWCLEDNEPKEAMENTREGRNPAAHAAYKRFMAMRSQSRKLAAVECNI
ncbi:secreted RxLR effector peptide protein, putative [Phytophthora infestans T30-4]|uniref:Secreted RxLR effector peptide protein, putative n=2 Tax=Phytophthora infestans TaxID=4787 RepID=D0MUU4_PHYIT|nr:secreted RxLR effector peptide protein, putative [Phytophthora infestans T30-4]EEY60940.1 secreted RxLR effector peptide protein, putative [Phytophthora infestans T30-4]|eukprot:XP_002907857.1 secreted RxLR effector peptide protein, putative [Phytophthora infestans T30-4]